MHCFELTPEDFVATLYRSVLRRPAETAGLVHWSSIIRATGDYTSVLARFVECDEFMALNPGKVARPSPSSFTGGTVSIRYDAIRALALDQSGAGLPPGIDVIVPVCNADEWIGAICDGYDALGLRPLFVVDARSSDRSLAILLGRDSRVFTVQGKKPYVESLLSTVIPYLSSRWVLRLDDDELPSSALLRWIAGNIDRIQEHSVALPRFWVHGNGSGRWEISDCRGICSSGCADHQTRLFQPSNVIPVDTIHTPGFEASTTTAPYEARIYHFDWIVRTYDERLRKIDHYKELAKGRNFRGHYLPEERDRSEYDFIPLDDSMIETVCNRVNLPDHPKGGLEMSISKPCKEVERFDHLGVKLEIPKHLVTPSIRRALCEGYYEALEAHMIAKCTRPSDIVLELGAGAGFLSTWIAQRLTTGRITSYEANPSLVDVALNTFHVNGVNVTLKNAIVTGGAGGDLGDFFVNEAFWASSQMANGGTKIGVATEDLLSILESTRPDILVVDIEGGEVDLFTQAELSGVRHVLIELHAAVVGRAGIRKLFQRMSELGFAYDPEFSSSYVVTFSPFRAM